MTILQIVEVGVGFFLVFTACAVITRPYHRSSRILLGIAVASFAVGLVGIADGLRGG